MKTNVGFVVCLTIAWVVAAARAAGPAVNYSRDIRPILSENCYACHGPDEAKRKAGLRLDLRDHALAPLKSGDTPLVPGDRSKSAVMHRLTAGDEDDRMPPTKSGKKLTREQIELIGKWIDGGAPYHGLWSLTPPAVPALPGVKNAAWPRNEIDRFILSRLEKEGLAPSPEADRAALVRRLTLDLTGLPPTPAEVRAFAADASPGAYEAVVDRLLASPHYGERMAVDWLDAARYADTHGYHIDSGRQMWRWRDWVIAAFNDNLPFDRFAVEQLAGDLLPGAAPAQKIASGFNRNHMINFEGGAVPDEYQTAYVIDRVNTTATVFLGLTVGCAQCHDHKFDPITQREFYQLYAYFNHVPENGLDGSKGNATPFVRFATDAQQKEIDRLAGEVKELEARRDAPPPEADAAQAAWEKSFAPRPGAVANPKWVALDLSELKSQGGATLAKQADQSVVVSGKNPPRDTYTITAKTDLPEVTAIRLEVLPDPGLRGGGPGRSENGNLVLTGVGLRAGTNDPVKWKAASADFSQKEFPVAGAIDAGRPDKTKGGWAVYPEVGKPHAAVFEAAAPLHAGGGAVLTITLDFQSQFANHQAGKFRLWATGAKDPHGGALGPPAGVLAILATDTAKRTDAQKAELRAYFRANVLAPAPAKEITGQIAGLKKAAADLEKSVNSTMVMQEMGKPRDTFMLLRGQYDRRGEKVTPGVPACLPPLPAGAPPDRLGLAQWLVSPNHPLTARVTVNRFWQAYFGAGLVKTAEDFGSQGEWPSHPELLDWLATHFIDTGWDVKALQKLIVTSAAYRQSSAAAPTLIARDPENRLLARGPRVRLSAEFIRDQALSAGGLLNDDVGGPSVSPYQPAGLWEELASRSDGANWTAQTYVQSHGRDLYRRSMYTFWKRSVPPPTLLTFDAPSRETCAVRRARTNTPLQALVLMNDPTYVEASRKLAERMMAEGPGGQDGQDGRIAYGFRLAAAREPKPAELAVLRRVFDAQLAVYRRDAGAAAKLLSVGEAKRDETLDPAELAANTMVASVILNLDETLTKQ